ncbi:unnamed protein product [Heterobilharzia americana]|nr:unnamed protein product [Heterobilharzia americana]
MPNCSITNNSPCFSTSDLGSTKSSSRRNQYFVPNLLTPSDMTKNRKFQLKATQSAVLPPNQSTSSNNLMNNPTHCSTNRVQVTVKKLTTPSSPSIHSADSCSQMNRINLDSVASYAQADPIETHDLVVAKMAADGVVWIPSSNTINSTTTELGDHRSILPKTDQLRWYSEEIEEEKVKNDSMVKRNSIPQSHDSTKHDSSATQNGLPRSNSLTGNQSVSMHSPSSSCNPSSSRQKASCQSNSNSTNSQSGSTESSTKQCELEAKLEEAMIIRKQQDDYIKQLQMYYDNLLTKHALAEVTIDQLRMGMRVGIDVNDADIPRNTLNKPRSHSMQTLHYNHKIISDENCTQANGYQNENNSNKNTTTTTVHYSSTPLLEQQRNRMKRNSSVHDERILSTTSESWETGLGSISNSSQMVQHSNISNTNTLSNGRKSSCSQDHTVVNENMHTNLSDQNNYRKISDPSPSRTSLHYGHSDDQIQKSNSCRRNTTTTSSFGIKQQQHMDIQTSASRNNSFTESEPRHDEDVGDEVIINEEVIDITPTNMYGSPNHEQPTLKKDQIQIADNVVTDFPDFTTVSPSTNTNSHLNDMICGPEAVQMELLLRVADLQTRLSTLELFATQHHFIQESDLMTIQLDYGTLKNFYDLAKIRWANDSYFDANKVLICELDHIGDQLNKLGSYATEAVLSPSSSNSSSPAPLPPHQPASVSDLPTNWRDLNIFKLSDQTSSSEHKPVKNTTDSGVLSSPSSLPSRSEHGRLSSISLYSLRLLKIHYQNLKVFISN